jgi:molybdopterin synthase catalytic subunit
MATVIVRFHAAARDLAATSEERIDVVPATVATLRTVIAARHARLGPLLGRMRIARNGDFVDERAPTELCDADELDVLPPVAGGAGAAVLADVRDAPLSVDEVIAAVTHPGAGGVCTFVGVVRDVADGKAVARLDYEAHAPLAKMEMTRILDRVGEEIAGARLAAVHRVGTLAVGDLAVVVAASAPHRAEAFEACRRAIDRIKETVPVWKKEWSPDGTAIWVNLE